MKKILLITLLAAALSTQAQTDVTPFVPGVTAEGVTYYLPRTVLRLAITTQRTDVTPGSLQPYAYRYLHTDDAPAQPSTTWAITSIKMDAIGIPDTTKCFSIKLKGRSTAPLVQLTESGILLAINTTTDEPQALTVPEVQSTSTQLDAKKYFTADILSATSVAKKAQLIAEEIYNIRESRNELMRGEAENTPKDGQQLNLMLSGLDTQDKALSQLFLGHTTTTTQTEIIEIDPTQALNHEVIFRFSQKRGIVDKDDLSGAPIALTLSVPAAAQATPTPEVKKKAENAVRYNVPARVQATLTNFEGKTLTEGTFYMAQFGTVETLSNTLFNKGIQTQVQLHPTTGGIKHLAEPEGQK